MVTRRYPDRKIKIIALIPKKRRNKTNWIRIRLKNPYIKEKLNKFNKISRKLKPTRNLSSLSTSLNNLCSKKQSSISSQSK